MSEETVQSVQTTEELPVQDTFNTDGLDKLVEDGEVENVCDSEQ